jgi:riboflavin kinase/FMN adenylyltransferase
MRVWHRLPAPQDGFGPSALTIGNFDGVHAGHRRIFRRVAEIGRANGWKPSVLTFDPHPAVVVAPDRAPLLLSSPGQRCEWMQAEGIEQVVILPFDRELSLLGPEEFVRRILVESLGVKAVLVGDNFRFGNRAAGDAHLLMELGKSLGFVTEIVAGVRQRGRLVSSSEIRRLIQTGEVSLACRLLERPYALEGEVVAGHGIGSRQTVPTLNLRTDAQVLPATGVYITSTTDRDDGRQWPSVTNVGFRPTFGGQDLTIETYLLSALEGRSPHRIRVEFLRRLRPERKFESPEALKAQIGKDVNRALAYFRRRDRFRFPVPQR